MGHTCATLIVTKPTPATVILLCISQPFLSTYCFGRLVVSVTLGDIGTIFSLFRWKEVEPSRDFPSGSAQRKYLDSYCERKKKGGENSPNVACLWSCPAVFSKTALNVLTFSSNVF